MLTAGPTLAVPLESLFGYAGQAAMIGWLILIFLPRRWRALLFVPRFLIPFGLSMLYAGLIFTHVYTVDGGGFGSLAQVKALFGKDELLLAGWVHYLAFDLFIGGWIAVQADRLGIARLIQAPLLAATFMFGPVGLALFMVMRVGYRRTLVQPLQAEPQKLQTRQEDAA
ncbi:ABA4-like family protein [Altererythrobacter sp. ZODW24]|uniref:ABA4-like family protein n=1 Tax=Altererythrobacter sp. ZODW24 TaxID=2185142 RepID=UPI000DF7784B|nr:ABA4-like family protein [Altererythrobacter sp. ZODW24]